jgi:hypothetical protein
MCKLLDKESIKTNQVSVNKIYSKQNKYKVIVNNNGKLNIILMQS